MADRSAPPPIPPAPLVAIAGWLLPGAGYLLIGQRTRGLTVGACIISLFILGLLVGGVRVMEVPGYVTDTGQRKMVDYPGYINRVGQSMPASKLWVMQAAPLNEVRDKPWSLPQLMAGPIAIVAGVGSVWSAATPDPNGPKDADGTPKRYTAGDPVKGGSPVQAIGVLTHARLNEIGSLYLSVAGLLNLMVIIDAAHRSVHLAERRAAAGTGA